MIGRFFRLLLVPVMLANQGLLHAHAHRGTDVAEPEGHASRPHYHIGGHGHRHSANDEDQAEHSHGHDSDRDAPPDDHDGGSQSFIRPMVDHDADAVYRAESIAVARSGRRVTVVPATFVGVSGIHRVAHRNDDSLLRFGPSLGRPASVFDAALPIYLRTLSLLI